MNDPVKEQTAGGASLEQAEEMSPDLKVEVNAFVWRYLPPSTTLGKADEIALIIYEAIAREWESNR